MQSMNQSLLALLAHSTITYAEAMSQSPDPEDLSLKLRKMFPSIEERGGDMSPSTADFSQILELQQFKKLYEEQEEKHKVRLSERDEAVNGLEQSLADRNEEVTVVRSQVQELTEQQQQLRSEYNRLRQEAQEKIDKLSGRIKELNQRIMDSNGK